MTVKLNDGVEALHGEMTAWRHHLHQNPETAFEEVETAKYVVEQLEAFGVDEIHTGLAGTGVVAIIKGREGEGSIGLRDAYNVIPQEVKLAGTVRSFVPEVQDMAEDRIGQIARTIANAHNAKAHLVYRRGYPPTVNADKNTDIAARVGGTISNDINTNLTPVMGSEDFTFMLQEKPGAYIMIGAGEGAPVHNPHYDIDERIYEMILERHMVRRDPGVKVTGLTISLDRPAYFSRRLYCLGGRNIAHGRGRRSGS